MVFDTSSSHLYAYLSGKARGSKKARSSSMSWSLILLTFSGLREERQTEMGGPTVVSMWTSKEMKICTSGLSRFICQVGTANDLVQMSSGAAKAGHGAFQWF